MATRSIYVDPRHFIVPAIVAHLNDPANVDAVKEKAISKVHFADVFQRAKKVTVPAAKDMYALVNGHGSGAGSAWTCTLSIEFFELNADPGDDDTAGPPTGLEISDKIPDERPSLALQNLVTHAAALQAAANGPLVNFELDWIPEPVSWEFDDTGSADPGVDLIHFCVWQWKGSYKFTG